MINWADLLYYDETSPSCLRWKADRTCGKGRTHVKAGDAAGTNHLKGYWTVGVGSNTYLAHRIVVELTDGKPVGVRTVDHINRVKTDNKRSNLRVVDREINNRNMSMSSANKSSVTGVFLHSCTTKYGVYAYWTAIWKEGSKSVQKRFSIGKLGNDEAFKLACKAREEAITKLNAEGAGYTSDHGKTVT